MTCVIGFIDKENNKGYIGSDSQICSVRGFYTNGGDCKVLKIFDGQLLVGFAGDCGTYQTLYKFKDNKISKNIDYDTLILEIIPLIKKEFETNKINAELIISTNDNELYILNPNYTLIKQEDFATTGSGNQIASGCLNIFKILEKRCFHKIDSVEKITMALDCVTKQMNTVSAPFYIHNNRDNEIIKIE